MPGLTQGVRQDLWLPTPHILPSCTKSIPLHGEGFWVRGDLPGVHLLVSGVHLVILGIYLLVATAANFNHTHKESQGSVEPPEPAFRLSHPYPQAPVPLEVWRQEDMLEVT